MIRGSHRKMNSLERDTRPYHLRAVEEHFVDLPPDVLENRVRIEVPRGHFFLFHSALLHGSQPYKRGNPRVSYVARFVKDSVVIPEHVRNANVVMPFI